MSFIYMTYAGMFCMIDLYVKYVYKYVMYVEVEKALKTKESMTYKITTLRL